MFGDSNMPLEEMQHSNVYLAYGILGCVTILLTLVMMNIFIAVVSNVYERIENASKEIYEKELDAYIFDQIPYGFIDKVGAEKYKAYDDDLSVFDDEEKNWKNVMKEEMRGTREELKGTKEELRDTKEKLERILKMLAKKS